MNFEESPASAGLRVQLRSMVDELLPADFLGAFTDDPEDLAIAQRFCRELGERGLISLGWPQEFGGQGADAWVQVAMREEMWARHEPRGAQYMNANWIAPAIMRFGTPAQQSRHLKPIADGKVIWCQGFSEPDSGSDLASLRTAATQSGEGWSIQGQKVWTSYATMAEWIFLLARTTSGPEKHHGITVFLVPMSRPGIRVRPIATMLGPHHLNEVFFDGLKVGPGDVLGQVDHGWKVVREVLAFERVGIARYARCERLLFDAPVALGEEWSLLPPVLMARWALAVMHTRLTRLLAYRVVGKQSNGAVDPADSAAYRISVTRLDQEVGDVLMDITGQLSLGAGDTQDRFARDVEDHWRYAQAATVASGTVEMQRILLSRSLVGKQS